MTELSTRLVEPEAPEISTQLDAPRASDETLDTKAPAEDAKPPKETRLEAIQRAAKDVVPPKEDAAKDEGKQDEAKPAAEAKETPAEAEASKDKPAAEERPRTKDHIEPPAKFLPRAKELWINTPREVKSEMQRVMAEAERETTEAREATKEYEAVRPYAEMARRGGMTLDQALGAYTRMETTLRENPTEGFRSLMNNMQMNPVQAIGHILAAYNIRPEQLAAHISQVPNEYTALAQPQRQQPQPNQADQRVQSLEQQIAQMRQSMQQQNVERDIIAPFAAQNPRYHELETVIASFLSSDMVPQSLSPQDRLAAAYDMAVRISPSSQRQSAPAPTEAEAQSESRAGDDFGGTKSVRGAPASGVEMTNPRKGKMSRGDALRYAEAQLGIAH